jgi:hypothetical protein
MRKLSVKWAYIYLNVDRKCDRGLASHVCHFGPISEESCGIFNHFVTMDEMCIHIYDPETEECKEWRQNGSPHPKNLQTQKS